MESEAAAPCQVCAEILNSISVLHDGVNQLREAVKGVVHEHAMLAEELEDARKEAYILLLECKGYNTTRHQ
jgi:hypothetical protein